MRRRKGRNGVLDYVEGHNVIHRLNEALDGAWSFEITHHEVPDIEPRDAFGQLAVATGSPLLDHPATQGLARRDLVERPAEPRVSPRAPAVRLPGVEPGLPGDGDGRCRGPARPARARLREIHVVQLGQCSPCRSRKRLVLPDAVLGIVSRKSMMRGTL